MDEGQHRVCSSCFREVDERRYCVHCGADTWQAQPVRTDRAPDPMNSKYAPKATFYQVRDDLPWKRPWLAAVLAAAVMGAGHLYVRKYPAGLAYLLAGFFCLWLTFSVTVWGLFLMVLLWNWQIWRAYELAEEFDHRVFERPEEF